MNVMHIGQMIGGLDVYIRNSITCASGKHKYTIIHGKDDGCYPIYCNGVKVKTYTITLQRNISLKNDVRALWDTVTIIKKEKPDVIHCHSAKGGMIGRIAGFITGTPTLYTAHAFSFLSSRNKLMRFIYKMMERCTRFNAYLLACSETEKSLGLQSIGYNKKKALVWRNAVPEPILKEEEVSLHIPIHPYLCYIGRPSYQKNPLFVVDMFAKVHSVLPNVRFYLLGVGYHSPDLESMQKAIRKLHLESYFFMMPWVNHNDAMAFVKHSIFYVSVSRYEGLPLSVIEAMALGKCIVASDVVGNQDCVWDKVNGRLLSLNSDSFAREICNLIGDSLTVDKMGKESKRIFEEEFRIEKRIHLLEDIYQTIGNK